MNLGSVRLDRVQALHHGVVRSIRFAKEETEAQKGEAIAQGHRRGLAEWECQVQCLSFLGILL